MHLNLQGGLIAKKEELEVLLDLHKVDALCMSEHHQTHDVKHFSVGNYRTVSNFARTKYQKGGVCILGNSDNNFSNLAFNNSKERDFEICVARWHISEDEQVTLCSVYRSPSGDFEAFMDGLDLMLQHIYDPKNRHILCGDININLLESSKQKQTLLNFLLEYNLKPTISDATRITSTTKTCIDNIFTDFTVLKSKVIDTIISDHTYQLIYFNINSFKDDIPVPRFGRNFKVSRIQDFKDAVALIDWNALYEGVSVNDVNFCFDIFNNKIQSVFNIYFPITTIHTKQVTCNSKKWYTPELINLSKMLHEMRVINKRINNQIGRAHV